MAVLVCFWTKTGRVSWWAVDARREAFQPHPHETIIEMPADEYAKGLHPQAFVSRETGLVPSDDRFVETDARGAVQRIVIADPDTKTGPRLKRYADLKAERAPKEDEKLPSREEPYTS